MGILTAFGSLFGIFGKLFTDVICYPMGFVLRYCYLLTGNYALSLIIFTLIIRCLLFPIAIKQQRSSAEMMRMKPKMDLIQKKYKKDQAKLQAEMSKLYQEEGYNPLSGCLPMLLQLPVLYGIIFVVYSPLTYILWYSKDKVDKIKTILWPIIHVANPKVSLTDMRIELYIAKAMTGHMDQLSFLGNIKPIDFKIFGIDLSQNPTFGWHLLVIIPILCFFTSMLSAWLSMRMTKGIQQNAMGGGMSGMMIFLMPLFTAWISLSMPAAAGFYWIISNIFMVIQVLVLQKYFSLSRLAVLSQEKSEQRRLDVISGKIKPSRMAEMAKRAMETQKQPSAQQSGKVNLVKPEELQETNFEVSNNVTEMVKVNGKGNKSRSQIKEEQRKRLAQSRSKENK